MFLRVTSKTFILTPVLRVSLLKSFYICSLEDFFGHQVRDMVEGLVYKEAVSFH